MLGWTVVPPMTRCTAGASRGVPANPADANQGIGFRHEIDHRRVRAIRVARFLHHGHGLYAHVLTGFNSLHEIDGIVAACPPHISTHDGDLRPEQTGHTSHHPALALFEHLGVLPAAPNHHPQEVHVLTVAAIQLPHHKIMRVAISGSPRRSTVIAIHQRPVEHFVRMQEGRL